MFICPKITKEKITKHSHFVIVAHEKFGGTSFYALIFGAPNTPNVKPKFQKIIITTTQLFTPSTQKVSLDSMQ